MMQKATIIIPTLAKRPKELRRALESVIDQGAQPLVVVNGVDFDSELLEWIKSSSRLQWAHIPEPNVSKARLSGRKLVESEYFGFLDDDDEFLPGAIARQVEVLDAQPKVDAVISNGWWMSNSHRTPVLENFDAVRQDPLLSLTSQNWLVSCGGLFRTNTVSTDYFCNPLSYFEWTYMAFKMASELKLVFCDEPAFICHDTQGSASDSAPYRLAEPEVLRQILKIDLPLSVRRALRVKLSAAEHTVSNFYLKSGEIGKAWSHHLKSLGCTTGFFRYVFYTRKLINWIPRRN